MVKKSDAGKASLDDADLRNLGKDIPRLLARFHNLMTTLRSFGIVAVYRHLEHRDIRPEACMTSASRSLDLMAFHGDKWLFEPWLEEHLERLRLRQGRVRFLLSQTVDAKTIDRCKELKKARGGVFDVRFFDDSAIFRIIIVDDAHLLLGHYGYEVIEKDGTNAKGWKSPQLFIEDGREWSLLIPFREMFKTTWEKAQPLEKIGPSSVTTAIKREFQPSTRS